MEPTTLNIENLIIEREIFDKPDLEELAKVLNEKLRDDFAEVNVAAVDCPDLTQAPFNLAAKGLCGNNVILDIGGPAFLLPLVKREKVYDFRDIPKLVGDEKAFIVGAGPGPWPYVGTNCEYIVNAVVDAEKVRVPLSRVVKVDDGKVKVFIMPADESRYCFLMNIYSSRGETGKVLKVHCKKRIGELNFISSIKQKLTAAFPDKFYGFGGVFVLCRGKAKQHIMPEFSSTPLCSDDQVEEWLKFYEMSAPLTAVGTFVTKDPGFDLRVQHFHSFGKTEAGHYRYDTTPDEVEYLAYFAPANILHRVDRPPMNIGFGAN